MAGPAWRGKAGPGSDWHGLAWIGRHGGARLDWAWLGLAWIGRQGAAGRGEAWIGRLGINQHRNNMKPEQVKELREKAGLSIAQAARCVQIADRSWQRYESGDRAIPPGIVELFCLKNGIEYQ